MSTSFVAGTEGYAEHAKSLAKRYEAFSFLKKHEPVLHTFPAMPCDVLDVGAGTGFDAAWFATKGCKVVAVEPVSEFLETAKQRHPSRNIQWCQDSLPTLKSIVALGQMFDLVMLSAVWMHIDEAARRKAMPLIASLLAPSGVLVISLRHGPVPEGRRMHNVSSLETISLAQSCGLQTLLNIKTPSIQTDNQKAGVTWSRLVFLRTTVVA